MNEFPLHQLANIDVQYEDNHVIVAVKPPNMLSQADKTGDTDILTQLKEYIKIKYNKPGAVYLGLVHRLDRPVGGLMVFARTSKAASRLSAQMREHEMGREYLCVVEGRVKDRFTCIDYLKKNEYLNKVEICDADEKGAQLAMLSGECLARKTARRCVPSACKRGGITKSACRWRTWARRCGATISTGAALRGSRLPCGATGWCSSIRRARKS